MEQRDQRRLWQPYGAAALFTGAAIAVGFTFRGHVTPVNMVMPFLLAVVLTARWWGTGAAVLASVLAVLSFDFFFVPPYLSFHVSDAEYIITFLALLAVALTVGTMLGQLRDHAAELHQREQETAALYAFSRSMVGVQDLGEISEALISHGQATLQAPVAVRLWKDARPGSAVLNRGADLTSAESEAVNWTLEHGRPTGWDESERTVACLPLRTANRTLGVVCVRPAEPGQIGLTGRKLLESFAMQAAVAVERIRLGEAVREAEVLREAERLQDALLHSISHSLRTPLASIIGSLSAVREGNQSGLSAETRSDLLVTACEEAERLDGLVGNLLDMTRLEAGHLRLLVDWYDMEDVIGVALGESVAQTRGRQIEVELEPGLPLVPLDQVLAVQVLENLLNNAVKYSPPGSPIEVRVQRVHGAVEVAVADRGQGVPESERTRIFEKFYRVAQPESPTGAGLGLAICKGIVEAHRGRIWAEAREGGGTVIRFTLPLKAGISGAEEAGDR